MEKTLTPHHIYEIKLHNAEITEIEKDSLADRKDAEMQLIKVLLFSRDQFLHSIELILNGSYGSGSYYSFARLSNRSNRRAWLFNTASCLEYRVPMRAACRVWNNLSHAIQTEINTKLDKMISEHDQNPLCNW
jgi:hypothetical protein